jgi:hypothetical protein
MRPRTADTMTIDGNPDSMDFTADHPAGFRASADSSDHPETPPTQPT